DGLQRLQGLVDIVEIRGVLHIGRPAVPGIGVATAGGDGLPVLVAGENVGVAVAEHAVVNQSDGGGDLRIARPDIPEKYRLVVPVQTQRLIHQVDADVSGQGVGHYERGRSQPVGLDLRV